jgi:hypothetical protein
MWLPVSTAAASHIRLAILSLLLLLQVLTDAFMVTAPHKRSSSWRPVPGTATDEAHLARISLVYEQYKARLAAELLGAAS